MENSDEPHTVPPDVRAAISDFLDSIQTNSDPFSVSLARDAVRNVFPSLEIDDATLVAAIASEATTAGLGIAYDANNAPSAIGRRAIERWENEGGA